MKTYAHIKHTFDPVYDHRSRVLILGTLPSVSSREHSFYYAHPQNRFWTVIAAITGSPLPISTDDKISLLLTHSIALWDVISECDIIGSSDASIKNVMPSDLSVILGHCDIKAVFANGSTAARLYNKYQKPSLGREIIILPSTSPANAAWSTDSLISEWSKTIGSYL